MIEEEVIEYEQSPAERPDDDYLLEAYQELQAQERASESIDDRAETSTPVNQGSEDVPMTSPENVFSIRKTIAGPSQQVGDGIETVDPDRTLIVSCTPPHSGEVELVREPERLRSAEEESEVASAVEAEYKRLLLETATRAGHRETMERILEEHERLVPQAEQAHRTLVTPAEGGDPSLAAMPDSTSTEAKAMATPTLLVSIRTDVPAFQDSTVPETGPSASDVVSIADSQEDLMTFPPNDDEEEQLDYDEEGLPASP